MTSEPHTDNRVFHQVFDALPDPALLWRHHADGHFTLLQANRAAQVFSQRKIDSFVGQAATEFFAHAPDTASRIRRAYAAQENLRVETYYQFRTTGDYKWLIADYVPFGDDYVLNIIRDISERKQIEEDLRAERDFAESLVETAQVIVLVLDPQGRIVRFNPYLEKLSGYTLAEVQGQDWFDTFLLPENRTQIRALFQQAVNDVPTHGNINPIVTQDGQLRYIEWYDKTLRDSTGDLVGLLAVGLDVTERWHTEAELRRSEKEQSLLLNTMGEMLAFYDTDLRILWGNRAAADSLGLMPDDLVGQHCYALWHGRDVPCEGCPLLLALKTGEQHTNEVQSPDGRYWSLRGYPVLDETGTVTNLIEFGQDITASKPAEQERERLLAAEREQRHLAETLIETARILNGTLDREQVLQHILAQLARVVSYDYAQIALDRDGECQFVALRSTWLVPRASTNTAATQSHIQAVIDARQPVIIADPATDPRWPSDLPTRNVYCWMGVPLLAQNRVLGALSLRRTHPETYTTRDADLALIFANQAAIAIENTRLYAQARQDAEVKTTLLREIHHRVKNNLQVISSLLDLQSDSLTDPQALQVFQESRHRIRSMALVHEKLYGSTNLESIDMADYVRSEVNYLFAAYSDLAYSVIPRIKVETITLDVDAAIPCGLIINELVSNALKHAFPSERNDRPGELTISLTQEENTLTLEVHDNGVGLPPDLNIEQSNSLGLSLVTLLTQQLGGTLTLTRDPGTTFTVTFEKP